MDGMSTRQVLSELATAGFRCSEAYLTFLVRQGHVPPPLKVCHSLVWREGDVDRLRRELVRRGRRPCESGRITP